MSRGSRRRDRCRGGDGDRRRWWAPGRRAWVTASAGTGTGGGGGHGRWRRLKQATAAARQRWLSVAERGSDAEMKRRVVPGPR
jgi:hypothetical protein